MNNNFCRDSIGCSNSSLGTLLSMAVKDESLGLETKGNETLGLIQNFGTCLVSDEKFWDSLVPVSSRWFNFYLVSSQSRPDQDE